MTKFSTTPSSHFQSTRFFHPHSAAQRAAAAVSACLTGEKVRYDGNDKLLSLYPLLHAELHLIPICPEIGAGLGVPRPPVQLIMRDHQIRARGREDRNLDVTAALHSFAEHSLQQVTHEHLLCGYLWKSRSPSCGLGSTPLFNVENIEIGLTNGVQADYFRHRLPFINHCEDTALTTESAALHFVLRCRLVFDVLYADAAPLQALHQHYQFVWMSLDECTAEHLHALSKMNDRRSYMAALLHGCSQIPEDDLLRLFL